MNIKIDIAGLTLQFSGREDFAGHFDSLARAERSMAMGAKTQKEARFHEGKAAAYNSTANLIRNSNM